jgi:phosphatidylserine/phosphatidylglycerophosphate/cardiolipin synthase-like enzyme
VRTLIASYCRHARRRSAAIALAIALCSTLAARRASASDQIFFAAVDNVTNVLVQNINAETVRLDVGIWLLSEHSISIAIANRWAAGVPVRLIGDRVAIFESDAHTKAEFYWLASQGVPIRLRYNPTWFPEINHWKTAIFVGQNKVLFGSGNFTPTELAPVNSTNYDDESHMLTDDPSLVNAFKTKFDRMWNDTTNEPSSIYGSAPYLKNWNDACTLESACSDYRTQYPNPVPMVINTARLEPDNPLPADMVWGQGPEFNNRLVQEINNEHTRVDLVEYRLTVPNITDALLAKFQSGVPVRLIIDTFQYANPLWPEYELTHAYVDQLFAAGIPIKQRVHDGVTHMKTLVTTTYATNASSNYAKGWQRDNDYFVSASAKPAIYTALKNRFQTMWTDTTGFTDFVPGPPSAVTVSSPASGATGVATNAPLVWNRAFFATSFDVYLGTSSSNMTLAGNVPAVLSETPPATYSFTPPSALAAGTTYFWKVVSRTFATPVNPALIATSSTFSFTTAGSAGPPAAPGSPNPQSGATGVSSAATLTWTAAGATSYDVRFGTANPPQQVSTGQASPSYTPSGLGNSTTYFWQIVARNSSGATTGPVWSFTTAAGGTAPADVVIYASDIPAGGLHGAWVFANDSMAAAGVKLTTPDSGVANTNNPLASPVDYVDVTFNASAGTPYTFWMRLNAINNNKFNDSIYVQFSDAQAGGSGVYPMNTTQGLVVNLATSAAATSLNAWGWQNGAYWLSQATTFTFPTTGLHTMRIQVREDGIQFDQIVLSPGTYLSAAPGPVGGDHTIVPKSGSPQPPGTPGSPNPANAATGVSTTPTLTWSAASATSYDVKFGTTNPPAQVSAGQAGTSYTPSTLVNNTSYFWQIVAHNSAGTTTGPVWSFTTVASAPPPGTPASPAPVSGATGVSTTPTLTWTATGATSYDVSFGTANPPPQVSTGQAAASYAPSALANGATYFWRIVAHNSSGATTGPVWSFTTVATAPPPPGTPASPTPASGATNVATNPTLTWTATNATSYDVSFGTANPPPSVATGQASAAYTPAALANSTTYFWRIVARNSSGSATGPVWSFTTAPPASSGNIVIYASDVPGAALHGSWSAASDPTSPNGGKLVTSNTGVSNTANALAAPVDYVDVTFTAAAGTPYTLWLRTQALNNDKFNDSLWVQFSDANAGGSAVYPLNTTQGLLVNLATDSGAASLSGWGWDNGAYWLSQPTTVTFATSGTHTLRIQVREDGVELDQIVLSPSTYLNTAPGPPGGDSTIVPKS